MTELLTAAQMRAIEEAAIASGEVTGLELMERAGRGVVEAILDWRPDLATAPHRAVVLCGPGNNGGDGFVVARLLKQRGWEVEVFLYGDEARLPPDATENARRWREMGEIQPIGHDDPSEKICRDARVLGEADLVIDALFGTGLTRPIRRIWAIWSAFHGKFDDGEYGVGDFVPPLVVAVDLPSGLCSDSGREISQGPCDDDFGHEARANLTISFHRPKVGHMLAECLDHGEAMVVCDIGLTGRHADMAGLDRRQFVTMTDHESVPRAALAKGAAPDKAHKYSHGHALILAGPSGKGGAARLAARGALRIGAGLVTVGCPAEALTENAARLDAVMLAAVDGAETLCAEIAARKIRAVCIGPGFGTGERLRAFVAAVLGSEAGRSRVEPGTARGERPGVVLDADALTEYRSDPETLFAMLHGRCVLTPHEGEFGRLFPDILAKLREPATRGPAYSKVDATREAAARAGCVVLFKGPDTVIANPDGHCVVNSAHYDRAAPWLATAGSGDVLAGFITGLLARGYGPMQAAETAAWLHVECARKFGPGLIAEDLPEQLPAVFRDLGL